ncbi:hypothetical protein D3C79_795120 [compost metagenome]
MQVRGHPAAGAQFQADVLLLALLHVGEGGVAFRAGVLIGLADLEQRGAETHALPVAFDAQLKLMRQGRGEDFCRVAGVPWRGTPCGQALGVAGIHGGVLARLVDQRGIGQQLVLPGMAPGQAGFVPGLFVQAYFAGAEHGLPLLVEADAIIDEQAVLAAVQASLA